MLDLLAVRLIVSPTEEAERAWSKSKSARASGGTVSFPAWNRAQTSGAGGGEGSQSTAGGDRASSEGDAGGGGVADAAGGAGAGGAFLDTIATGGRDGAGSGDTVELVRSSGRDLSDYGPAGASAVEAIRGGWGEGG